MKSPPYKAWPLSSLYSVSAAPPWARASPCCVCCRISVMVAMEGPWGRPCSGRGLHCDAQIQCAEPGPRGCGSAWTDQAENPRPRPAGRRLVGDAAHTSLRSPPSLHPRLRAGQTRPGFARRWAAWTVGAKLKWDQTRGGTLISTRSHDPPQATGRTVSSGLIRPPSQAASPPRGSLHTCEDLRAFMGCCFFKFIYFWLCWVFVSV